MAVGGGTYLALRSGHGRHLPQNLLHPVLHRVLVVLHRCNLLLLLLGPQQGGRQLLLLLLRGGRPAMLKGSPQGWKHQAVGNGVCAPATETRACEENGRNDSTT